MLHALSYLAQMLALLNAVLLEALGGPGEELDDLEEFFLAQRIQLDVFRFAGFLIEFRHLLGSEKTVSTEVRLSRD